ncbi:hypothetical protein [Bradyrhizobium sp. CCBAU 25338]|nr:hypothetical protein [Bradyrhizobium sp. CCBAU 25338]
MELYDHRRCHAASSFCGSGFPEATVACFDFSGDPTPASSPIHAVTTSPC